MNLGIIAGEQFHSLLIVNANFEWLALRSDRLIA